MHRTVTRTAVVVAFVFATLAFAQDDREVLRVAAPFDRASMDATTPTGQSVAEACPKSIAMAPYAQPYAWPEARATVRLDQTATSTHVAIHLTGVPPRTRFSAWVRPRATASGAIASGEVPLSPRHVAATLPGNARAAGPPTAPGSDGPIGPDNEFWSDARGDATFKTRVALPLVDAGSAADAQALAALLITSHCADRAGRTPELGPRQPWFQWPSVPEASRGE